MRMLPFLSYYCDDTLLKYMYYYKLATISCAKIEMLKYFLKLTLGYFQWPKYHAWLYAFECTLIWQ